MRWIVGALRVLASLRDVNVAHLHAWHAETCLAKALLRQCLLCIFRFN
jgi:hypothetical protein